MDNGAPLDTVLDLQMSGSAETALRSVACCPTAGVSCWTTLPAAEFLGVMARDIRSYDSEQDIRNAWKVCSHEQTPSALCLGSSALHLQPSAAVPVQQCQ